MTLPHSLYTPVSRQQKDERKHAEELARLDKIVENSSEKNRNFFIAYLGLLIYVQAIIFSTTDLQLLVSTDGLKLPLVDLTVPLVGFYFVVPIFVIALHFNFLQNLESHHYKLMRWQELHTGGVVPRQYLFPFLFNFAILEQDGQFQWLVKFANRLLCYNLAPITLGLLLIRFSDRQDFMVTAWHYLLFVFDSYLVWKFGVAIRENEQSKSAIKITYRWPLKAWNFLRDSFRYGLHGVFGLLILLETVLAWLIGGTSDESFVMHVQPWAQPLVRQEFLKLHKPIIKTIHQLVDRPIEWLFPRIVINPTETVWKPDISVLEIEAKLAGQSDWVKYFNTRGKGFRPTIDRLRFINLEFQNLPRARLSNISLQGADLSGIKLQGASLDSAKLQGVNFTGAQLQQSSISNAQMQNANFFAAQLQSAVLSHSQMQGAYLVNAKLQNASLWYTQLQGSNLTVAQLQNANLVQAQLQGAILINTELQAAHLYSSNLIGTIVQDIDLRGAENIPEVVVFGVEGEKSIISNKRLIWSIITDDAKYMTDLQERETYLARMEQVEKTIPSDEARQKLKHNPTTIAGSAFSGFLGMCSDPSIKDKAFALQSFRTSYRMLRRGIPELESTISVKNNPDYAPLLTDIDRKLCTLPECADIRDKIEGLDCKPFLKESPQKH
jgi:uncharacterized protein YjbI with pentapeptide repeats